MSEKYSISIWKDVPKDEWADSEGNVFDISYIDEEKVADIGSNTMTSLNRALNPQLVSNINGTNTFSFLLYYTYIDTKTGKKVKNPFVQMISNETKIKVFWKNKWYDFVVKNIQESSNGKSIQYTCTDLYINELSKTGFNLEFAPELNNNQGTVKQLAELVLEGSEWHLVENNETIQQEIEEPVYELLEEAVSNGFTAKKSDGTDKPISAGSPILLYYSVLRNKSSYLQFFYNGKLTIDGEVYFKRESSDLLTIDGDCLYVDNVFWQEENETIGDKIYTYVNCYLDKDDKNNNIPPILHISKEAPISTKYRAKRLVRAPQSKFDPVTKKYVDLYNYNGTTIYKYIDNEYLDPTVVQNLIINSEDFSSDDGWKAINGAKTPFFELYPKFIDSTDSGEMPNLSQSYLKIGQGIYYNAAFQTNTSSIMNGIQPGQKFIFRVKAYKNQTNNKPNDIGYPNLDQFINKEDLTFFVKQYKTELDSNGNKTITFENVDYFVLDEKGPEIIENDTTGKPEWLECEATCLKAATVSELLYGLADGTDIGFFIQKNNEGSCWIEEIQFFQLVYEDEDKTKRINPGDLDKSAVIQPTYRYYEPTEDTAINKIEDIKFLYVGTEDWNEPGLKPLYNENFEKIRSITEKNSNRFNLIQTLAETFECWARFDIGHNDDGSIKILGADINAEDPSKSKIKYDKTVRFVKDAGHQIGIGFKYGIDLKEIQRTIDSDQIATKIIVSPNNNEYAQDGFCTIARSEDNYSKENFILNFDYYISHGLLDGEELNKDLYLTTPDSIRYYYELKQNNTNYDTITEKIDVKKQDLLKRNSFKITYDEYIKSATQQQDNVENDLLKYTGTNSMYGVKRYMSNHPDDERARSLSVTYSNLTNNINAYNKQLDGLQKSINALNADITNLEQAQKNIVDDNKKLHEKFNNKYSRYIQEGSWISEDYIDDNLYYMDAVSVAYTSSRPQVSYNISVLRLSALEKFKNKVFHVGDISYVEDTEFFGYVNGTNTPYRELVLISEITSNFDDPAQDKITVQNYRTQFEDLFQRITASAQSLQYNQGSYQKASNAFESDGTIKVETLQNSIAYNQELVYSAQNESIISDSTGITLSDIGNPNNKTKITSGGIFISVDGGNTWKNAVRGEGISTQYLTAGSINANNINILDGAHTTFRWDSRGINAFSTMTDEEDNTVMINLAKFVRFDRYGIYGVDGTSDFNPEKADHEGGIVGEDKIWDTAQFGMTWKGFFVKNRASNGWVEVSSLNDVAVFSGTSDNNIERIKIGRLSGDGSETNPYVYGIRISDADGAPVMETADDGTLWLKKELNISSSKNYNIQIGFLDLIQNDKQDKDGNPLHRTVNVNDKFIVYEDGSIKATEGEFTGTINATGGTIGGLTIEQIVDNEINFELTSSQGLVIDKEVGKTTLIAHAYKGTEDITEQYQYTWYIDGIDKGNSINNTYELSLTQDITEVYFIAELKGGN